jgi:microcin C transport system substrate-binding protein
LAYWDIFGRPQTLPSQTAALMQTWWIDPEKQKALETARNQ